VTRDHRSAFWHGVDPFSAELFQLTRGDRSWDMHGVVLVGLPDGGTEIRYRLQLDERWRSHQLHVEMSGAHTAALNLVGDGRGSWSVGGGRAPELHGCVDLDPRHHAGDEHGSHPPARPAGRRNRRHKRVAWVRFPELEVQSDEQTEDTAIERASFGYICETRPQWRLP
jgi:hypothetical protein